MKFKKPLNYYLSKVTLWVAPAVFILDVIVLQDARDLIEVIRYSIGGLSMIVFWCGARTYIELIDSANKFMKQNFTLPPDDDFDFPSKGAAA